MSQCGVPDLPASFASHHFPNSRRTRSGTSTAPPCNRLFSCASRMSLVPCGCQQSLEEITTSALPTTRVSRSATRSARPSVRRTQRGRLPRSSLPSFFNQSIRTSRVSRTTSHPRRPQRRQATDLPRLDCKISIQQDADPMASSPCTLRIGSRRFDVVFRCQSLTQPDRVLKKTAFDLMTNPSVPLDFDRWRFPKFNVYKWLRNYRVGCSRLAKDKTLQPRPPGPGAQGWRPTVVSRPSGRARTERLRSRAADGSPRSISSDTVVSLWVSGIADFADDAQPASGSVSPVAGRPIHRTVPPP